MSPARSVSATADASKPPVVVFSPNHWHDKWTSRHRISVGLAERGWPVIYSSGPYSLWERGTDVWNRSGLFGSFSEAQGLTVDEPGRIEAYWPKSALSNRLSCTLHSGRLRRRAGGRDSIAFVFHPSFWPRVERYDPAKLVYFAFDSFALSPGWTDEMADWERRLVDRADLGAAYSKNMLDRMARPAGGFGKVMHTGVDFAHFAVDDPPSPADLAAIPEPRIGYTGNINQKLDFGLLLAVARAQPGYSFVFVGPAGPGNRGVYPEHPQQTADWQALLALPNVHHLGPRPFAEVPAYMAGMTVNMMFYRLDGGGWWEALYPLKMHEYLAIGRPVVSTGQEEVHAFADVIDIVDDVAGWQAALARAIDDGGLGTPAQRREVARANSWDSRLDDLSGWMTEVCGG